MKPRNLILYCAIAMTFYATHIWHHNSEQAVLLMVCMGFWGVAGFAYLMGRMTGYIENEGDKDE